MNGKIFKMLAGFIFLRFNWKKTDGFVELQCDIENISNMTGIESFLDIPTYMRQGRVLSR